MTKQKPLRLFKRLAPLAILSTVLTLFCSNPQNPFDESSNAALTLTISSKPAAGYYINDTLSAMVKLRLCKFFDTVKISFGNSWDTALIINSQSVLDSFTVRHILSQTGTVSIRAVSVMKQGSPRDQTIPITVLGYAPRILRELPAATSLTVGKDLSLSILASGTDPIQYKWTLNSVAISGANASEFKRTGIIAQDAGDYRCIATNPWGTDTSNPSAVLVFPAGTPDAPQGLRIAARSGGTITFIWSRVAGVDGYKVYKDTIATSKPSPLAMVYDTSFTTKDTGRFYYWVTTIKGTIESPASTPVLIAPIDMSKPRSAPHWVRDTLGISLAESESFSVNLADSCIDTNSSPMLTLSLKNTGARGRFTANSLYSFTAGHRDSGTYRDTILAVDGLLADTLALTIRVRPTYCTLSVAAANGLVTVKPTGTVFRWADTVGLTAVPNPGYGFTSWSGDATGTNFAISLIMTIKRSATALFSKLPDGIAVPAGGSINEEIAKHKGASSRPAVICPDPGVYESKTIKIEGLVKITVQ